MLVENTCILGSFQKFRLTEKLCQDWKFPVKISRSPKENGLNHGSKTLLQIRFVTV